MRREPAWSLQEQGGHPGAPESFTGRSYEVPGGRTPSSHPRGSKAQASSVPTALSYLLEPADAPLQPALLQVGTDLGRDVQPRLGVVGDVAHKGKGLVGLGGRKVTQREEAGAPPYSLGWLAATEVSAHLAAGIATPTRVRAAACFRQRWLAAGPFLPTQPWPC